MGQIRKHITNLIIIPVAFTIGDILYNYLLGGDISFGWVAGSVISAYYGYWLGAKTESQ